MRKLLFAILALCATLSLSSVEPRKEDAVTYTLSGGRFGDNLLAYLHAKWIAYRYNLPLLYKPFPYADQLVFHEVEQKNYPYRDTKFPRTQTLGRGDEIKKTLKRSTLYILPYFPECAYEHAKDPSWPHVAVDWENPGFRALLKELVQPNTALPKMELPKDRLSVAVHVRRGGDGFDSPEQEIMEPLKAPPNHFFIDQIRNIYKLFDKKPLYVYIFTDNKRPDVMAKNFKEALSDIDVTFAYRQAGNTHDQNVLEDFFAMQQFECLIRPESNYSITASKIGDFKVIIYPESFHIEEKKAFIDRVHMQIRDSLR